MLLKKVIIFCSVLSFVYSCSRPSIKEENPTIQQLIKLADIDFDNHPDVQIFITADKDSAEVWCKEKTDAGCIVQRSKNKTIGTWTCKSIPKESVHFPEDEKLLNLLDENGEFLLEDED